MAPYQSPMSSQPYSPMAPYQSPMLQFPSPYSSPQGAPAPTYAPSGAALGASVASGEVTLVDNAFQPGQMTVNQGDSVVWSDGGRNPHTVTADDGSFDSSNGTSATMSNGQTFSHAFSSPGTFPYHCKIHGGVGGVGMSGVIVVQAAPTSAASSPTPAVTPPTPAGVAPSQMAFTGRPIAQGLALGLLALVLGSVLKVTAKRTATA
jgi:plastocyanin